jgi:putative oxidoreductase
MYIPGLNIKETAPVGLMILRVVLGIAFAVHGWMKWQTGIDGVAGFFGSIGVPAPELMAWVVTIVELVGGIFLIIGFLTQFVSILLLLDMLGAILFTRISGPFIDGGGISWEKEAVFAAAAVCLILAGPGIWSVDDIVIDTRTRPSTA